MGKNPSDSFYVQDDMKQRNAL